MSSDGRYMYHHPQGLPPSYEYASYPPPSASYENPPIPSQASMRPMRSSSSQPHSPHQQSQFTTSPPQPQYAQSYGSTSYMAPPAQWNGDNWTHYNQSYPPPPPTPEGSFSSGPGRSETVATPPSEQRPYSPLASSASRRPIEDRPIPPPPAPPPQHKNRPIETASPIIVAPTIPGAINFMKLLESYRLIIDASEALSEAGNAQGRTDAMERMLQSANHGFQILESSRSPPPPPPPPPQTDPHGATDAEEHPSAESTDGSSNPTSTSAAKRQNSKSEDSQPAVQEGQTCLGCNATSTPEWRRGPMGPRTLCNACGLVYAKLIKKRVRESSRAQKSNGAGSQGAAAGDDSSGGEGGSDDDDDESYAGDRDGRE